MYEPNEIDEASLKNRLINSVTNINIPFHTDNSDILFFCRLPDDDKLRIKKDLKKNIADQKKSTISLSHDGDHKRDLISGVVSFLLCDMLDIFGPYQVVNAAIGFLGGICVSNLSFGFYTSHQRNKREEALFDILEAPQPV